MADIGDVAKKVLAERSNLNSVDVENLKRAAKSGDKQMAARLARVVSTQDGNIDYRDTDTVRKKLAKNYYKQIDETPGDSLLKKQRASYGKELNSADITAPANKKTINPIENAEATSKRSMTSGIAEEAPFSKLERDLPKGGRALKVAAEEGLEKEGSSVAGQVAKRGLGKLEKMGMAGLAGGALGLGVNALMEGLDAEEAGSDEERMDEAARGQYMKTEAKLKADKANSLKASTKKRVEGLPAVVKETTVYRPQPRSEKDIVSGFNEQLDKNFGKNGEGIPEEDIDARTLLPRQQNSHVQIEGLDNIDKVMRDEMKQGAARANKKPISKFMKR